MLGARRYRSPTLNRQGAIAFDLLHHGIGARLAHTRQHEQHLSEEAAIGGHIRQARLDEVVETSRYHVTFQDFRSGANGLGKTLEDVGRRLVEQHLDEDQKAVAEPLRIELRPIPLNKALALKP